MKKFALAALVAVAMLGIVTAVPACPPSANVAYCQQVAVVQAQVVYTQAIIVQPVVAAVQVQVVPQVQYVAPAPQIQVQPQAIPAPQPQQQVIPPAVQYVPQVQQSFAVASVGYGCAVPSVNFASFSAHAFVRNAFVSNVVVERRAVFARRGANVNVAVVGGGGATRVVARTGFFGRNVIRIRTR